MSRCGAEAVTAVLDVEPAGYADAADVLGDDVAECVRSACVGVMHALDGSGGMAGSDPVGASWGTVIEGAGALPDPLTTGPYAVISQNGDNFKIALEGNPTLP
jgi:hypothetical protein